VDAEYSHDFFFNDNDEDLKIKYTSEDEKKKIIFNDAWRYFNFKIINNKLLFRSANYSFTIFQQMVSL
jgi:hypothetical protein